LFNNINDLYSIFPEYNDLKNPENQQETELKSVQKIKNISNENLLKDQKNFWASYGIPIFIGVCFFIITFAYSIYNKSINDEITSSNLIEKKEINEYYAWVDNLRVRKDSNMNEENEVITSLDEGEKIFYMGIKTEKSFSAKLRGKFIHAPLYKIKTSNDKIGWVFSGGLSVMPVNVENYKVALFFDDISISSEDISINVMNELVGSGIDVIYIDHKYFEVPIVNNQNKIIGVEDISKKVKKYKKGIICVEKGKRQHFIPFSPNVSFEILKYFGIEFYQGC
tara:strand:- start:45 stop:887 length:843 start_codon:yes stop_codon:yes gene_type:complete